MLKFKQLKDIREAKEKTEYDYEGDMARGQLQSIINNAQRVHDMLKDNDNLPEWVQSKITLAEDYISTVSNYMQSEVDESLVAEAKEADYGPAYQDAVKRVGEKAKQGKMKTVWVPDKYGTGGRYKVVPVKEEQIDELNKDTLISYQNKADKEIDKKYRVLGPQIKAGDAKSANETSRKINKRLSGVDKAVSRLNKEEVMPKLLSQIVEAAKLHPMALHVKPVSSSGGTKYQVHAVGKDLSDGIKVGEHLTDSHLDDAAEMGAKIKHVKEGVDAAKKNKKDKHDVLQQRDPQMRQAGTDESVDYTARFMELMVRHGHEQKLVEWHQTAVDEEVEHINAIKKNIATRNVSTDKDTDIIRDYDVDDVKKEIVKQMKHHHNKVKNFRTYHESVEEAISSRMALSKAADMEYKAANTDDPAAEDRLKGKAKALKRAARLAQRVASTVDVDPSKLSNN